MRTRTMKPAGLSGLSLPLLAWSLLTSVGLSAPAVAQGADTKDWITAWATSMQDPLPAGFAVGNPAPTSPQWAQMFPGNEAADQTFRLVIRPQAAGDQVRLHFSNVAGSKPVRFDHLSIATRAGGKAVLGASGKAILFSGSPQVTIEPGGDIFCDPIDFAVEPEKDVAVTFHVVGNSGPITWHAKAMATSFMTGSGAGNKTADEAGADLSYELRSWVWLSELQAYKANSPPRNSIVAIGDSITDGSGSTIDGHDRWEDFLNRRLRASGSANVVINAGIGGNRVTSLRWGPVLTGAFTSADKLNDMSGSPNTPNARCDSCGQPAVTRLERDVFSLPNVSAIILFEGVNDIGAGASYGEVIAGMQDIVVRAHTRGIKVFGATITPYYGFAYDVVYPDLTRRQVNDWMRTTKIFDGLFDYDAVVRDPAYPARINPELAAVDHIHLNPKGYSAVADSIPLASLDPKLAK